MPPSSAVRCARLAGVRGAVRGIALAGRFALVASERCLATTDGRTFHRRSAPPRGTDGLAAIDGAIYSLGEGLAVTHDRGETWQTLPAPPSGAPCLCLHRDARGAWWLGCRDGVWTSQEPARGWTRASFSEHRPVCALLGVPGGLLCLGGGGGYLWDGSTYRSATGFYGPTTLTAAAAAPSGALIAVGLGGLACRSTDGGLTWRLAPSGTELDFVGCAFLAGALYAIGGDRGRGEPVLVRSDDEGESFEACPLEIDEVPTCLASWGSGALFGGDRGGIWSLARSPDGGADAEDPYWAGARDELSAVPLAVEAAPPRTAAPPAEREGAHAHLLAEALRAAEPAWAERRAKRPPDPEPRLAQLVDDAADDDLAAAHVYADWLHAQGDPRGELAAIQLQLAAAPAAAPAREELQRAEQALLAQHADPLLGKLAPYQDVLSLEWRAGFLHRARIAKTAARSDGDLPRVDIEAVLCWLLDEPSARFLRDLTVGIVSFDGNSYGGIAARIGQCHLPALRSLFLGDFHSDETELNWSSLGDLEPMYAGLPALRSLKLRSGHMQLGAILLPRLERFELVTGGLDRASAQAIAAATWPGLRALSLQVGPRRQGEATTLPEDLQPILDGVGLPRLAHLGLTNLDFTDALLEPLARGPLLPQLETLDLALGTLSDAGAELLFRYQRAFAHLRRIDVEDNFLTDEGIELLAASGLAVHIGDQRDDDGDPDNRYAAAYE